MAIDFSKIDIAKDVSDDIKKMTSRPEFYEKVVKLTAILHADSADELTSRERDPSGNPWQDPELTPSYARFKMEIAGNKKANLRLTDRAMDSMRIREKGQNRGAEIYFQHGSDYMYKHQTGTDRPKRPIFPETKDVSSAPQMEIHRDVHEILGKYLNQPRRITIVG